MRARWLLISALFLQLSATAALAQCPPWRSGPFDDGTLPNGTDGVVNASISWDPDDGGPLPAMLVVAGDFTSIEGVAANNIAMHDPGTGQWQQVGGGIEVTVFCLAVFEGDLVAGCEGDNNSGTFDQIVRRWDGATWQNLSAFNTDDVFALAVYGGALYAGGDFVTQFVTGGAGPATNIARWNAGANLWETVDSGVPGPVSALAAYGGDLYVGGYTQGIPGFVVNFARWNPTTHWTQISTGNDLGGINDFTLYDGQLIVAGGFNTINGQTLNCIGGWNGSSFTPYDTGFTTAYAGGVLTVEVHDGLVAGGFVNGASGQPVSCLARWPVGGSAWQPLGGGTDYYVDDLTSYDGELVAVGTFTQAEGRPANHMAHWDGSYWSSFGGGAGPYVAEMTTFNGRLVVGGAFHQPTTSLTTAHDIVAWDGNELEPLGVGMNGDVYEVKGFHTSPLGPWQLIAGGAFTQAGGVPCNHVARWTEPQILPPPAWEPMGAGFDDAVNAIEMYNGEIYAAGNFTFSGATSVSHVARWNVATGTWQPVGTGVNGSVAVMKVFDGALYVGGNFSMAGGVTAGGLARWDGTSWSGLGMVFDVVMAMEVYDGHLVIGGQFAGISGSPDLIQYDGSTFSRIGTGGANQPVRALRANGGRLYVGGSFTSIGGTSVQRLAYWDGTWHDTHYGTTDMVLSLAAYNGEVEVGGWFAGVDYNGTIRPLHSPFWGRYTESGLPWFTQQPVSVVAGLGDDVSFSAQIAGGFSGVTYGWVHDDLPLSDGPTGTGSMIAGSATTTLFITDVTYSDHGEYRLIATNGCGDASSAIATLTLAGTAAPSVSSAATVFEAIGPNPAGDTSRLSFSLAHDAVVGVKVYDLAGRLVRGIDLGRLPAGSHWTRWDVKDNHGERIAAAPYFVRLDVDGRPVGTRRITVLH